MSGSQTQAVTSVRVWALNQYSIWSSVGTPCALSKSVFCLFRSDHLCYSQMTRNMKLSFIKFQGSHNSAPSVSALSISFLFCKENEGFQWCAWTYGWERFSWKVICNIPEVNASIWKLLPFKKGPSFIFYSFESYSFLSLILNVNITKVTVPYLGDLQIRWELQMLSLLGIGYATFW